MCALPETASRTLQTEHGITTRGKCQRPYQLYTLVLTLHDPYRQKCQVSRKHTNVCSRVHRHVWVTWSLQKAK